MTSDPRILTRGVGLGAVNAILLSAIIVPAFLAGLPPMPQPVSLAFAESLLGRTLPLPGGLLFHLAYVTFWSTVWLALDYPALRLRTAFSLGVALWALMVVVIYPINGWGFLGLAVSPKLLVFGLVPHLLFAAFLWGLARLFFRDRGAIGHAAPD